MAEVRLGFDRRDIEKLSKLAHKLKGSLALLGAKPGRAAAEDVEAAGRIEDWGRITEATTRLEREVTLLQLQLGDLIAKEQECKSL